MKTKNPSSKVKTNESKNGSATIVAKKKSSRNGKTDASLLNDMSADTLDLKQLLGVLTEVKNGNFKVRMPHDQVGLNGKICDTLNDIISLNEDMMHEFTRAGN